MSGAGSFATAIMASRHRIPAIVVFPQARQGTRWSTPVMQDMALRQLDATVNEFNGDRSRLYLMGFSLGAAGALRIAYRLPDTFAAVAAIAGRGSANPALPQSVLEEDFAAHAYLRAVEPYDALADRIKNIPIRIVHGDADTTVPVSESRLLIAALRARGAKDAMYTEYPETSHSGAAQKAYADDGLFAWMFQQRLGTRR